MKFNRVMSSVFLVSFFADPMASKAATINVPADQPTIQDGIDAALNGDEVVVAPGTYNERVSIVGKSIRLTGSDGALTTEISGSDVGRTIYCDSSNLIMKGLTISRGFAVYKGGGLNEKNSDLSIESCIFKNNISNGDGFYSGGGGIYLDGGNIAINNCTFIDNVAGIGGGGAIALRTNRKAIFSGCTFSGNMAEWGGAILSFDVMKISNCVFDANTSSYAGAIVNFGLADVRNCLFVGNTSSIAGGAYYSSILSADAIFVNSTFTGNQSLGTGGGIMLEGGIVRLHNSVLWGNADGGGMNESGQIHKTVGGNVLFIDNTCVQGWTGILGGTGNIGDDPLFVTGPQGDVYLSQVASGQPADSPCVGTGKGLAAHRYYSGTTRTDEVDDVGIVDMGYHYNAESATPGDLDGDMDVDIFDFLTFANCFNGSLNPPIPICVNISADMDFDGDVDGSDFLTFSNCFNGSLNPPSCP